jgi:hypothetical protein
MHHTFSIALTVGTLLTLINEGDRITGGGVGPAVGSKILANYLIPRCVSGIGYISARRAAGLGAS